jgi:hypothetical protein
MVVNYRCRRHGPSGDTPAFALVDDYQLWLHAGELGGADSLFRDGNPAGSLRLIDNRTTRRGLGDNHQARAE